MPQSNLPGTFWLSSNDLDTTFWTTDYSSPQIPMTTKIACDVCGQKTTNPMYMYSIYDGEGNISHKGVDYTTSVVCEPCAHNALDHGKSVHHCHKCAAWHINTTSHTNGAINIPCHKHSAMKGETGWRCDGCQKKTSIENIAHYSSRGYVYCSSCTATVKRCRVKYCHAWLAPAHRISRGGYVYCAADCQYLAKGTIAKFHDHVARWDYKLTCHCYACTLLRDADTKRWPQPKSSLASPSLVCNHCQASVSSVGTDVVDDVVYCHYCSVVAFTRCEGCNHRKLSNEFGYRWTSTGRRKCVKCSDCMELMGYHWCGIECNLWYPVTKSCGCDGVLAWNYKPPSFIPHVQDGQSLSSVPLMGLELEVEAQKLGLNRGDGVVIMKKHLAETAYAVHDGSLLSGGKRGFEIVTHPFTFEWLDHNWPQFEAVLTELSEAGFRSWVGRRCGIHVHISRTHMSPSHQMRFIRFVYGFVNLMMCVGQRDYDDPYLNKYAPFDKEHRASFGDKITGSVNPGVQGHYAALSTTNPNTLEARWFRGTLRPSGVRKNIEFMDALWYFTRDVGRIGANEFNFITWLQEPGQRERYNTLLSYLQRHYLSRGKPHGV